MRTAIGTIRRRGWRHTLVAVLVAVLLSGLMVGLIIEAGCLVLRHIWEEQRLQQEKRDR
jgi:hypothetical protein